MDSAEDAGNDLDPSELGTKEYWEKHYQNDLEHDLGDGTEQNHLSELESWFDDVGAPAKTSAFLTSESFPLSPNSADGAPLQPSILDVGTGNGSTLLSLRLEGGYQGPMVGVDYSEQSVTLARKLCNQYMGRESEIAADRQASTTDISFEVFDVMRDDPKTTTWWLCAGGGFDLVLDKGTFDAVCLSSETIVLPTGLEMRTSDLYPAKIASLIKPNGFFLITSCNWTQNEVIRRFTTDAMHGVLEVYDTVKYPTFRFGGQQGQGVVSVCFHKVGTP